MSDKPIISLRNFAKTFGQNPVLQDINLDVTAGDSVAIIGGSGSGKSVLLKCIAGLMLPDYGSSVIIDDEELARTHILKRTAFIQKFAMLFQSNALFDSLTAKENILFGLSMRRDGHSPKVKRELSTKVKDVLSKVELSNNILDLRPSELSGGQQKRVALARAIIRQPSILFLDEPTAGLDPITSRKISDLIHSLQKIIGFTLIVISHDVHCVRKIARSCIYLAKGKMEWSGAVSALDNAEYEYLQAFAGNIKD